MTDLNYEDAAHLLRRMGFGGPPDEVEDLSALGREGAVDYLINYDRIDNRAMEDLLEERFDLLSPDDQKVITQDEIKRWWLTRMALTRRQFEEKLTLFWHNHFATGLAKVKDFHMFVQNLTLRRYALARFDTLTLEVARDPAMLVWLDGIDNVLDSPNENFARELQELFTMGIFDVVTGEPNYTEQDVKEIARAFTGWRYKKAGTGNPLDYQFFVEAARHDNRAKIVYGETGNFDGADIIALICARRATARYLVREMLEFFVYPMTESAKDKTTIEKFADVYVRTDHSIKELAQAIFTSDEFFSDRARFALVKSPVEFILGSMRMIGAGYNPGDLRVRGEKGDKQDDTLHEASRAMGQDLFNPPDVNGWDLHLGWVNTAVMLERYNFANKLTTNRREGERGAWITTEQLRKHTKSSAKKTVKRFLSLLGPLKVEGDVMKTLIKYLQTDDHGNTVEYANDDATIDKKIRGLTPLIMALPEFQLN